MKLLSKSPSLVFERLIGNNETTYVEGFTFLNVYVSSRLGNGLDENLMVERLQINQLLFIQQLLRGKLNIFNMLSGV